MRPETYHNYWGKTASQEDLAERVHLLPYHSLDVAAAGANLLQRHPPLARQLSSLLGMEPPTFHYWAVLFLTLHDLGKFAVTFQGLRPDLLKSMQGRESDKQSQRHDTLGYLLWRKLIRRLVQDKGLLPPGEARGRRSAPDAIQAADIWMAAMTGHHGTPPKPVDLLLTDAFEATDQQAAEAFVSDVIDLFAPTPTSFPNLDPNKVKQASWWLAGFAVLSDWIGSHRTFFPYRGEPMPLEEYWEIARIQAEAAVAVTELLPKVAAESMPLQAMFNSQAPVTPTPLQHQAGQASLNSGPQLFILEDVTGAGKTEAALILAQRLMAKGQAHGVYFGLPTMATANAMYERLGEHSYRRLFRADQQPSLVLAHGAARLSDAFRQSIFGGDIHADDNYEQRPAAAAHCSQWLADNRKKALLADIGIGTLDQALLAILPSRHQSLRLLGLIGKVLIVDEVHACDAYMHPLLCRLLNAHAAAGGSAILLSATLPQKQRQALADAFAKGLDGPPQPLNAHDYPLFTQIGPQAPVEQRVDTRESVRREVQIDCLESEEAVEATIDQAMQNGQCLCWIRNSVADAREAYARLREKHPHWRIDLFHARFALADRLDIEQRVLDAFGKNSRRQDRKARLLIATQVVEQSLDIDFDHMITDLAPIDLIIQRAGRLRRHRRDTNGNPTNGPDQRGTPVLHLHTPVWQEQPEDDWFAQPFRRAAAVYPNHGQLWLGLKLLKDRGGFRMPDDARDMIEGVYGENAEPPEGLQGRTWEAQGEAKAQQSQAMLNELKIELGYNDGATNRWWDDSKTPTRLGDPTSTVWLARWQDGRLLPWRENLPYAWQQSSLSLRSELIDEPVATDAIPQAAIDACRAELPAEGKWGVLLALRQTSDDTWEGRATNTRGEISQFHYSPIHGLITGKEIKAMEDKGA